MDSFSLLNLFDTYHATRDSCVKSSPYIISILFGKYCFRKRVLRMKSTVRWVF